MRYVSYVSRSRKSGLTSKVPCGAQWHSHPWSPEPAAPEVSLVWAVCTLLLWLSLDCYRHTGWWAGLTPRLAGCMGWPGLLWGTLMCRTRLWHSWLWGLIMTLVGLLVCGALRMLWRDPSAGQAAGWGRGQGPFCGGTGNG